MKLQTRRCGLVRLTHSERVILFKLHAPQNGKLACGKTQCLASYVVPCGRPDGIATALPSFVKLLLAKCMYRTLTSLSLRLCKHSRTPRFHQILFVTSRKALLTPRLRFPNSWNCQTSLHNSTVHSLPGMAAQMLLGRADAYEGFIVSADDLPTAPEEFDSQLENSLQVCGCTLSLSCAVFAIQQLYFLHCQDWATSGKKGIWITVPAAKSQLIPIAVKHGFEFHHAEKTHIALTRWLPTSENTLPPNASHQVC